MTHPQYNITELTAYFAFSRSREKFKLPIEHNEHSMRLKTMIIDAKIGNKCDEVDPWLKHIRCSLRSLHVLIRVQLDQLAVEQHMMVKMTAHIRG